MAKLPQPPFPLPFPVPATTEEAFAHAVEFTEGIDATRPTGPTFTIGFFADETGLLAGAKAARAAGYTSLQTWSPYAVHGLDAVLGLQRSLLGRPVFLTAVFGWLFCFIGISWLMVGDWPVIYGGKPFFSWQLFVIPTLEAGLLFAALANLNLCFAACKLLPDPFAQVPDARVSDDQFALAIGNPEMAGAEALLRSAGATGIRVLAADIARGNPIFQPLAAGKPVHA